MATLNFSIRIVIGTGRHVLIIINMVYGTNTSNWTYIRIPKNTMVNTIVNWFFLLKLVMELTEQTQPINQPKSSKTGLHFFPSKFFPQFLVKHLLGKNTSSKMLDRFFFFRKLRPKVIVDPKIRQSDWLKRKTSILHAKI